jgi:penicillin V acylase-like amidase (Ntn superfamily)
MYIATLEANPCGQSWAADAPGKPGGGLRWTNKYGFVGVTWSAATPGVYDDGLNEHGLSVAQNQLDETTYPPVSDRAKAVDMRAVVGWLLGMAANVSEARQLLEGGAQVWGHSDVPGDEDAEHQHLHILDAAGDTLLAEWMHGELHLYGAAEGAWRTVTNSPDFPTQRSMRAYAATDGFKWATTINGMPAAYDSLSRQRRVELVNAVRPKVIP